MSRKIIGDVYFQLRRNDLRQLNKGFPDTITRKQRNLNKMRPKNN